MEGRGIWKWGKKREILYLSLHCHHQNDSVHKPQPFSRERRAEAELNRGPSVDQPYR